MNDMPAETAQFSLEKFFAQTATQGEKAISIVRLCISALIFLQYIVFTGSLGKMAEGSPKYWIITTGIVGLALFSGIILAFLKPHHSSNALRLWSIAIDVIGVALVLLPSTIWPSERYHGFLARMDVGTLLLVVVGSAFRLSTAGVFIAGMLTILFSGAIIFIDQMMNRAIIVYSVRDIVFFGILVVASILISFSIRKRIIRLVSDSSQAILNAERARMRLGVYISQELVDEALTTETLKPGGNRQSVAILFSDLRGFTTYSEKLAPDRLVNELNDYLEAMVRVIRDEGGVVDKYIGDAIMVVFGIPNPHEDDAVRAVRCAWKMQHALKEHNIERRSRGLTDLQQGIGVHFGEVVAGNLGTSERLQYTVIGDAVNLASRLESATKELECPVLISQDLVDALPEDNRVFNFSSCGSIRVKGRDAAIEVYSFA